MTDELETPNYRLATIGTRLLANIIDAVPGALLCFVIGILFIIALAVSDSDTATGVAVVVGFLVCPFILGWLAYNIYLVSKHSQTFGKRIMKIKMVRTDNSPVDVGRWIGLRTLLPNALSSATFGLFGLLDICFIFGEKRQCLHDMLADTKVVEVLATVEQ